MILTSCLCTQSISCNGELLVKAPLSGNAGDPYYSISRSLWQNSRVQSLEEFFFASVGLNLVIPDQRSLPLLRRHFNPR